MTPETSLELYSTPLFSRDDMRRLIGFGEPVFNPDGAFLGFNRAANPGNLSFAPWLAELPSVYKTTCAEIVRMISKRHVGTLVCEQTVDTVISEIYAVLDRLFERLEARTSEIKGDATDD